MRQLARAVAWVLLAFAATSCDDDPIPRGLPIAEAERARELELLALPPVERISREAFTAAQESSGQATDEGRIAFLRDTYGRLGFFGADYDLRVVRGQTSTLYAAFYSSDDKTITLIGEPEETVVLHELVHALQDQHFDLAAYREDVVSSDEALAKSALVEGDAVLAELRHQTTSLGYRPETVASYVTRGEGERFARRTLDENAAIAPFFLAQVAFAYTYGPVRAVEIAVLEGPRVTWSWERLNATFRERRPLTTRAILGAGVEDRVVDVGLTRLPAEVAASYAVDDVDRLGAWYTYLLFYRTLSSTRLEQLALSWGGDQLVGVHRRDTRIGTPNGPSGVVWTSTWASPNEARALVDALKGLHGLTPASDDPSGRSWVARDGEAVWLEQRGALVSLVKNVPFDDARVFADRALSSPGEQKTLPIRRRVVEGPRRFPCPRLNGGRALRR